MIRSTLGAFLAFFFLLLAVNILWLDIAVFSQKYAASTEVPSQLVPPLTSGCDPACQKAIVDDLDHRLRGSSSPTPRPRRVTTSALSVKTAKEFYIPLGSGTTRSAEYVELNGAEASIDTSNYPNIQEVTFEVFLRNPTGNGVTYAKLFNVTDKHDVWFSEVNFVGGGLVRKEATITLEPGNKLYRVYLKSTLAYDVYVDNARIKIITQ